MRKCVRSLMFIAALAALCSPLQSRAATLTDWQNLNLPDLGFNPLDDDAMFFQWTAKTNNSGATLLGGLDFGLVMYLDEPNERVNFAFVNFASATVESSITDIYFRDPGGWLTPPPFIQESPYGPDFQVGASPSNPSGIPGFNATQTLSAESAPPTMPNGIESKPEWVMLSYDIDPLDAGSLYADVISGAFRIAMRVQGIRTFGTEGGQSDTFEWTYSPDATPKDPPVVPIPGAASLGLLGFGLIAAARRKAHK